MQPKGLLRTWMLSSPNVVINLKILSFICLLGQISFWFSFFWIKVLLWKWDFIFKFVSLCLPFWLLQIGSDFYFTFSWEHEAENDIKNKYKFSFWEKFTFCQIKRNTEQKKRQRNKFKRKQGRLTTCFKTCWTNSLF